MPAIDQLLRTMLAQGGSDLHLMTGQPPRIRISGSLTALAGQPPVTAGQMESLLHEICPPRRWTNYLKHHDVDLAYDIPGAARFRVNFLYNHWGQAAVFRQIPASIRSLEELNLPPVLKRFTSMREGLVLVTGPTGNGKSTTLAALLDHINATSRRHIITVEDPVEFVHTNKKSVIVHREVGEHTLGFAEALRGAMRADPDVILVGEMRDLETMRLALRCASMGMLVFATLHTNNAPKTIDRIIDAFPAEEQNQIRVLLASCLAGVVSQLLCKRAVGGRVAVQEILLPHEALGGTIRSGKISAIRNIIDSSMADGMVSMDFALKKLLQAGEITAEEAYMKANDKASFARPPA